MGARRLCIALLACALLALGGCAVEGRVQVTSVDAIEVDLLVTGARSPYCGSDLDGLTTTPGLDASGVVTSCRYVGMVDPDDLSWALGTAEVAEYFVFVLNPPDSSGGGAGRWDLLQAVDLRVIMPGTVVEATSGLTAGSEVHITDPRAFDGTNGLRLVSLRGAGPPPWVGWLAGGMALGVGSTLAVLAWRRRRSMVAFEPDDSWDDADDDAPAVAEPAIDEPATALPPDPAIWARPEPSAQPSDTATGDPSRWAPDR